MQAQRIVKVLIAAIAAVTLAFLISGCQYIPESTFKLANESRMPRWVVLSAEPPRAALSLSMSCYLTPRGYSALFLLQNAAHQTLNKTSGKLGCPAPFQLKHPPAGLPEGYSLYQPVTVEGLTEMIEHRRMESVFYVTDDPAFLEAVRHDRL